MGRYEAQQIQFATVAAALAVQRERVAVKGYVPDCADVADGLRTMTAIEARPAADGKRACLEE